MNRRAILLAAASAALVRPARAQAPIASPWAMASHSAMRLVAGDLSGAAKRRLGVEITLTPGFKTYWRSPGDSGVPPRFDWSGSQNIETLNVRWPAPERFADAGGSSIGYAGDVVFPVAIQPSDPGKPVVLVLKLDYAVCEKLCIPVMGEASLVVPAGERPGVSERLKGFEAQVPRLVEIGPAEARLAILRAEPATGADQGAVRLMIRAPAGAGIDDIFIEGPDMWSFGRPSLNAKPDGLIEALVPVVDRPRGKPGPQPFVVTIAGRPGPVETRLDLDIPAPKP